MDGERIDPHLRAALDHAPDRDLAPPPALNAQIVREARRAVAPREPALARAWSWLMQPAGAAALATVALATVITLMWRDGPPQPDEAAGRHGAPAGPPPAIGAAQAPRDEKSKAAGEGATAAATTQLPAPAPNAARAAAPGPAAAIAPPAPPARAKPASPAPAAAPAPAAPAPARRAEPEERVMSAPATAAARPEQARAAEMQDVPAKRSEESAAPRRDLPAAEALSDKTSRRDPEASPPPRPRAEPAPPAGAAAPVRQAAGIALPAPAAPAEPAAALPRPSTGTPPGTAAARNQVFARERGGLAADARAAAPVFPRDTLAVLQQLEREAQGRWRSVEADATPRGQALYGSGGQLLGHLLIEGQSVLWQDGRGAWRAELDAAALRALRETLERSEPPARP
jgi:hypothetical protein